MSYLHLPSLHLADCSKGTISLWFRVSEDSRQKAIEYGNNYSPPELPNSAFGSNVFRTTIPFLTFGRPIAEKCYGFYDASYVQPIPHPPFNIRHSWTRPIYSGDAPCEPSHLGVQVGSDVDLTLKMVFQAATEAEGRGLATETVNMWVAQPIPGSSYQLYQEVADASYIRLGRPEYFEIIPKFNVEKDKWHHLLVSFDFSTSVDVEAVQATMESEEQLLGATIKSFCKFWYAFDDEDKNGKDNIGDGWVPQDPNGIVPASAKQAAEEFHPRPPGLDGAGNPVVTGDIAGAATYHWSALPAPMPLENGHVGLPAGPVHVDTIYHCEMAEFQFFADLVLDTSVERNRRAFIDFQKDRNGNPTLDEDGKRTLIPVNPTITEEKLDRRPDILLHTTSNWKKGKNTGSVGLKRDPSLGEDPIIKSGQFTPEGGIKKYSGPSFTEALT